MKTIILFAVIVMIGGLVAALDTTHTFANSGDFWDTSGYVNVTPSTKVGVLSRSVDARIKDMRVSTRPDTFSTFPPGLAIVIH